MKALTYCLVLASVTLLAAVTTARQAPSIPPSEETGSLNTGDLAALAATTIISVGADTTFPLYLNADEAAMLTAFSSNNASGDFRSYLLLEIYVDGELIAQDQSYVPVSWQISHHVSTSAVVKNPGQHSVRLRVFGEGLRDPEQVKFQFTVFKKVF